MEQTLKAQIERRLLDAQKSRRDSIVMLQNDVLEMGLFTLHLGFEKLLKALYLASHQKQAPKTHDLLWLEDKMELDLNKEDLLIMTDLNHFFGTMRYDEGLDNPDKEPLTTTEALAFYTDSEDLWTRLSKEVSLKLFKLS